MHTPRSRRALLTSVSTTVVALAGCSGGRSADDDEQSESDVVSRRAYDCDDVDRPEPETPAHDDALEPASYPSPPPTLIEDADQYALEFERAYRRNAFLEEYGSTTRAFEFQFETRRTDEIDTDADRKAVLVALVYSLETETRQTDERTEWNTRVTYYVDERVALRARYHGIADTPAFEPDPRTDGTPVACFDRAPSGAERAYR